MCCVLYRWPNRDSIVRVKQMSRHRQTLEGLASFCAVNIFPRLSTNICVRVLISITNAIFIVADSTWRLSKEDRIGSHDSFVSVKQEISKGEAVPPHEVQSVHFNAPEEPFCFMSAAGGSLLGRLKCFCCGLISRLYGGPTIRLYYLSGCR